MSTIHFIGGEKGGVGKSVVARLCAQYCIDRAIPFCAVDADGSHGALLRFYADYARPVRPATWRRYLALFLDSLPAGRAAPTTLPEPALSPAEMEQALRSGPARQRPAAE